MKIAKKTLPKTIRIPIPVAYSEQSEVQLVESKLVLTFPHTVGRRRILLAVHKRGAQRNAPLTLAHYRTGMTIAPLPPCRAHVAADDARLLAVAKDTLASYIEETGQADFEKGLLRAEDRPDLDFNPVDAICK